MPSNALNSYNAHHEEQVDSKNNGNISPWDSESLVTLHNYNHMGAKESGDCNDHWRGSRAESLVSLHGLQADSGHNYLPEDTAFVAPQENGESGEKPLLENEHGQENYGSTQPQETAANRTVKRDSSCLWLLHLHLTRSLGVRDSCDGASTTATGFGCIALSVLCFAQYGFCGIEAASVPGFCSTAEFEAARYTSGVALGVCGLFCTHEGVKEAYQENICGIQDAVINRYSAPASAPMQ